jgi:phosphoribosylformylglycinamidine synthase
LPTVHDISEGGLAVALAECCMAGGLGARVELPDTGDAALFGEGPGGALLAGPREAIEAVPGAVPLGAVTGESLEIAGVLSLPVAELASAYEGAIPAAFA